RVPKRAEVLAQRLLRLLLRVYEHEALPHLHGEWLERVLALVEVPEAVLLRHAAKAPIQRERPAVELAEERLRVPVPVLADELVAAMPAHIVKSTHDPVATSHDQDGRVEDRRVLHHEVTGPRDL